MTARPARVEEAPTEPPFEMWFDIGTIKHLGLQMYSTLPPVIAELVANAWDANASSVDVTVPEDPVTDESEIIVVDDGDGMTERQVREAYLIVGRDRREKEHADEQPKRRVMGRKGIGKFSGFGVAGEIEIESVRGDETSRFRMNFADLKAAAHERVIRFPKMPPSGTVASGTKATLRGITKYRTRRISIPNLRRGLARRFAVIGAAQGFEVRVNGEPITVEERDLKRLLAVDAEGAAYLWEYDDVEVAAGTGWRISGWIGALERTTELEDGIERGIALMARGKLVQEPFVFGAEVGQQFALSYLIGELTAEFVDEDEDTVATTRNSLVWDSERNRALLEWGRAEVNRIAREWASRRSRDREAALNESPLYQRFKAETEAIDSRAKTVADRLIREVVTKDLVGEDAATEKVIQMSIDFLEFDSFVELAEQLRDADNPEQIIDLFREWEVVEAREMMRVTEGRIATIQRLQRLVDENALEVPTLHNFLKEFPWVLDPRWDLIADEQRFSDLLRAKFPDDGEPEEDRRIDFLCVREGTHLVVVEIKRPQSKASNKELDQIEDYVAFMRDYVKRTTDPDFKFAHVVGYLLCGTLVDTYKVREKIENLARSDIYVRRYADLLDMVRRSHQEFLERYERLKRAKQPRLEPEPGAEGAEYPVGPDARNDTEADPKTAVAIEPSKAKAKSARVSSTE